MKLRWDYFQTRHGIRDRVLYWNRLDVAGKQDFYDRVAAERYDLAIFAGGQLFMDWLAVDLWEFLRRFRKFRTPVFFNACGAGLSVSREIREMLGNELKDPNVRLLSTRDDVAGLEKRYELPKFVPTFDPALWAAQVYGVGRTDSETVGLGVMNSEHAGMHRQVQFWKRTILELERRGRPWKMFCNGAIDDYEFGKYILRTLGFDWKRCLLPCPRNPRELTEQIAAFGSLISFRLHSHILAASLDIPAVAIVWDEKLRFFYRHLGCEERCLELGSAGKAVADALEKAEKTGYDRQRIEFQQEQARSLLLEALKKETEVEQRAGIS